MFTYYKFPYVSNLHSSLENLVFLPFGFFFFPSNFLKNMETVKLIFSCLKDDPASLEAFKVKLDVVDQPSQVKDKPADGRSARAGDL